MTTGDGFVLVRRAHGGGRPRLSGVVSFGRLVAQVPEDVARNRPADWLWNGNGIARLRFANDASLRPGRNGSGRTYAARSLYRVIGRDLRGRYPIVREDEDSIDIDISGGVA